ncbi:hypothetical protein JRQ81_011840 [Phrynocephalus forsythii]|uniref:protein-histidine N-methyltransferase n=1 Tax=Phrynocephalus forsythii TaxID=171643 RepID=A0A9Q1B4U1_9SAUR|nr:hypothetical protein JRQ81_011840 [Phrynocephalus forsythii]
MDFQFNFSVDTVQENRIDATGNGEMQEKTLHASCDKKENATERNNGISLEKHVNNQESLSKITGNVTKCSAWSENETSSPNERSCLQCAKEHNIPKEGSKILENKAVVDLPGTCCASISVVETTYLADSTGEDTVSKSISSHSDLITGIYEGGLKIWECTFDLMDYLLEADIPFAQKSVLDLGCGAGLLGILALKRQAKEVHFQDYNSSVIEEITLPNVLVNCARQSEDVGKTTELCLKQFSKSDFGQDFLSKCKFFSGEWSAFSKLLLKSEKLLPKYDFILTSETIYNPNYYEALHHTLSNLLGEMVVCFWQAKHIILGVEVGFSFLQNLLKKKIFLSLELLKLLKKD